MKKEYQAPEVELIALTAQESTTSKDMLGQDLFDDYETGDASSIFD